MFDMNGENSSAVRIADLPILLAGVASTALTLFGVFLLAKADPDFNIMGWYGLVIIPVGAILVGIASGSGYGLVSWLTGRKVGGGLLVAILVLLVLAYGAAQWVEYRSLHLVYEDSGREVGFFEYYDVFTRGMTFALGHSKTGSMPLGRLGYLFRFLELIGFSAGGLVIPLILKSKPYCERCSVYMRKRNSWWIPAAVPSRKVNKKDSAAVAAYDSEMKVALENGLSLSRQVTAAARERKVSLLQGAVAGGVTAREAARLERRIEVKLSACPRCAEGIVSTALHSGKADKIKIEKLDTQRVDGGFVRSLPPPGKSGSPSSA
jgi:hypothetical protein